MKKDALSEFMESKISENMEVFEMRLNKSLVKSPIVILLLIGLMIGGGMAAFVALWNRQPTVTLDTKGFEAILVETAILDRLWEGNIGYEFLVNDETNILNKVDDYHYEILLAINDMRSLTEAELTIDMTDGTDWFVEITKVQILEKALALTTYTLFADLCPTPMPKGSSFALSEPTAIYEDNGVAARWHFILIEYHIEQTGEVITETAELTCTISLAGDMYEPA